MSDASGANDSGRNHLEQQTASAATPVEMARAEIARLEKKLGEMAGRREHNRAHRAAAGLPSNTSDGKNLADLRSEALRLSLEEDDLQAWLIAARERLAAAEHAALIAEDVERAKERLKLADLLRRGGAALTEAFSPERFENW